MTPIGYASHLPSGDKSEIGNVSISLKRVKQIRADYVRPMAKKVRKKRRFNVPRKRVSVEPNICDDQQQSCPTPRYKGLVNLGNTCYANSVVQCLFHCPLTKQVIENVPSHALSNEVLREFRTLFMKMANNDSLTYQSPYQCFHALMRT